MVIIDVKKSKSVMAVLEEAACVMYDCDTDVSILRRTETATRPRLHSELRALSQPGAGAPRLDQAGLCPRAPARSTVPVGRCWRHTQVFLPSFPSGRHLSLLCKHEAPSFLVGSPFTCPDMFLPVVNSERCLWTHALPPATTALGSTWSLYCTV